MANAPVILLVDDDPDFIEISRHLLEGGGYSVACCYDPQAAWQRLQAGDVALVISDLMMGSLDSGFNLAGRIKADPRFAKLPVIIATSVTRQTGYDFKPKTDADLAAMNADAYFDKPLLAATVLPKIAELLGR